MQSSSIIPTSARLGRSDLLVRRIGLGAWPMAGLTSLGVTDQNSVATIRRALDLGINHLDTAYSYGVDGRSDRVIAVALQNRPERVFLASKVGAKLDSQGIWRNDARPESMIRQAQEIRDRLRVDAIDLLYLHAPDPNVSLAESADALQNIVDRGWARWAGVSNVDLVQLELFHRHCPVVAVQTFFNLFQQQSVGELREFCQSRAIALVVYWVLMKGMLAGHMLRDHPLDLRDRRRNYPIYQGQAWQSAQDLLDRLRVAAAAKGCSVAQWVLAWTLTQPGVSVALVGAKHPDQIEDTAQTFNFSWEKEDFEEVDGWLAACSKGREW